MELGFITLIDVQERNPVAALSFKEGVDEDYIIEIVRLANTDPVFTSGDEVEYGKLSCYLERFWKVEISPRRLAYIHKIIKNHNELLEKLSKGCKMRGTYRELVMRKA
jgi:hypothetical protein